MFGRFAKAKVLGRFVNRFTSRFVRSERGNVLPLFALAIIPIFGLVGVAIDYSRAGEMRSAIQSALDSTALMLSKEASNLSQAQLQQKATDYFTALLNRTDANGVVITPTMSTPSSGSFTLNVSASGAIDTTFARVLGQNSISIGSSAEVSWGIKRLELVMALDNTGSMANNNKMTELKKAAKSLLDTLFKSAKKAGDIKVAIIPFTTDVNVGTSNVGASWLDWTDWDSKNGSLQCPAGSTDYGWGSYCWSNTKGLVAKVWGADHSNWNGCVWDRLQDYDTDDTAPTSVTTKFQPHQASNCPVAMLPLSDIMTNWVSADLTASSPTSTFGKKINSMNPAGNTNVTIGAVWGYHALTSSDPLTEASAPATDLDKVLILLTDGDNTQNRFSSTQSQIDARTTKACANIKNANIKVYTVRVLDGNASLLQGCASKPEMYYDVQNSSQLNLVFTDIAQNLASLRISK
ncbi:MAG: VWA domain-containing protein [Variibacter sp.]